MRSIAKFVVPCLLVSASPLWADTPATTAPPTPPSDLPAPNSDHDTQPPVASPVLPPAGIVQQAGVGGDTGYGRAGVLELGGSAGLTMASEIRVMNFSPSIGWFVADNFELSAIGSVANVKAGNESATLWSAVIEPSYHLPLNRSLFAFGGLGVGAAYEQNLGAGVALAPRIGANVLVGRSGVLTPSLSYEYITHNAMTEQERVTLVAVSSAMRVNIGYTAMW